MREAAPAAQPVATESAVDVFLSYSRDGEDVARALARGLTRRLLSVFFFGDEFTDASHGEAWQARIAYAMSVARTFILVVSPGYASSDFARAEMNVALWRASLSGVPVIPVILPGAISGGAPAEIRQLQGIVLADTSEAALESILGEISNAVQAEKSSPESDQLRAAAALIDSLVDSERVLGPDHPSALSTRANLANVYLQLGRPAEAAALLEATLVDSERVLGPDHPSTLSTRANLANVYLQLGRSGDAATLLEATLVDSERVLGPDHPSTLSTRANLANVYLQLGRPAEAAALLEATLVDSERVLGPDHPRRCRRARTSRTCICSWADRETRRRCWRQRSWTASGC